MLKILSLGPGPSKPVAAAVVALLLNNSMIVCTLVIIEVYKDQVMLRIKPIMLKQIQSCQAVILAQVSWIHVQGHSGLIARELVQF